MGIKTEVYSWRVSPDLKRTLEEAAREAGEPLAVLIERAARELLARRRALGSEAEQQAKLRAAVAKALGTIRGDDSRRSERAREAVRRRLRERHVRCGPAG